MDLHPTFVEYEETCPIYYTLLPYGNPGMDSLLCGRNETSVDDQWIPTDASSTALWQQNEKKSDLCEFDDATVSGSLVPLSPVETDCCLPNAPHGFWDFEFSPTFWEELWTEDPLIRPSTIKNANVIQTPQEKSQNEDDFGRRFLKTFVTVDDNACCHRCDNIQLKLTNAVKKVEGNSQSKRSRGIRKKHHKKQRTKRGAGLPKGLTVCLRTLLRQLLAGTGWVVDPSIGRDEACNLIKLLVGPEIESRVQIDPPKGREEDVYTEWRQAHYTTVLAEIMTFSTGTQIKIEDLEAYITLRRGPYRLSGTFKALLKGRQWPPCLPSENCLRAFGCYRLGEANSKKLITEQCPEETFDFDA